MGGCPKLRALEFTARYSYMEMRSNELGDLAGQGLIELREIYSGERSKVRGYDYLVKLRGTN